MLDFHWSLISLEKSVACIPKSYCQLFLSHHLIWETLLFIVQSHWQPNFAGLEKPYSNKLIGVAPTEYGWSHYYSQLGNALQNIFLKYSALIMGTLKRSTNQSFNFSVQSLKFTGEFEWTWFAIIFPYGQKSMSTKKRWYTPHLKEFNIDHFY